MAVAGVFIDYGAILIIVIFSVQAASHSWGITMSRLIRSRQINSQVLRYTFVRGHV